MIQANTTIPTKKSEVFSTASDSQPSVEIHILQGERPMAVDNRTLGRFHLDGIPPAPRGVPQIEVTFDIDANGMLHVSAKDKATNKEQSIRITSSSGLSKEEIDKMKADAQAHASEDKKRKDEIETKNQADNLVFQTRKQLKDLGEKMSEDVKSKVESAANALEEAIKAGNIADIKAKTEVLNSAWNEASSKMYESARSQGPQGPQAEGGPQAGGDKGGKQVENADFEVVDDKDEKKGETK
jgi:molecular chaperone DnaK